MAHFTIEKGRRYKATITLGLLQSLASNDMIAAELRKAGFTEVSVSGSGGTRIATGVWSGDTASGAIPDEVTDVTLIA